MGSLLDPAILFFVFGMAAGLMRSNLEIPAPISRFLSLYLLMALGLKGGFALARSGFTAEVVTTLAAALLLAVVVPVVGYLLLRRLLSGFDAAAIAATYGSVSAVTFITAAQHLENTGIAYGGHMAAAMALMESPAIVFAVVMANMLRRRGAGVDGGLSATAGAGSAAHASVARSSAAHSSTHAAGLSPATPTAPAVPMRAVLHEALTDGAQLLLLGAMVIGMLTGEAGQSAMQPFSGDLFKGMLAFFLLDMGLLAARNVGKIAGHSPWLLAYAVLGPLVHAALALALAAVLGLAPGNAALLMVLAASASYIAVPAVLRHAIPEANASLYFGLSLGLTFPLNILLGIPLYTRVAMAVLG